MSIFNRFRTPPPPPPIYRRQPFATATLVLAIFATLIIGPTKYIAKGMDAKIDTNAKRIVEIEKGKATNQDVKDTLHEMKETRKDQSSSDKEQNRSIQTNQIAIEKILIRQEIIKAPGSFKIKTQPTREPLDRASKKVERITLKEKPKVVLTPEQFEKYLSMSPEIRIKYKKYLERTGKDVSGLPD